MTRLEYVRREWRYIAMDILAYIIGLVRIYDHNDFIGYLLAILSFLTCVWKVVKFIKLPCI